MSQYYAVIRSDDYLEHHGIKGMKWGVRRFQNADGSRTAAGLKRYAEGAVSSIKRAGKGLVNRYKTDKKFRRRVNIGAAALGAAAIGYGAYRYSRPEARLKRLDRARTYDAKVLSRAKDPATIRKFQERMKKNTSRYLDTQSVVNRRAEARAAKASAKAQKKSFNNSKKWLDRDARIANKEAKRTNREVKKYFKSEARKSKVQALKNRWSDAKATARAQTYSHNQRQRELNRAFKGNGSWLNNTMNEGYLAGRAARNNYTVDDYNRDRRRSKRRR